MRHCFFDIFKERIEEFHLGGYKIHEEDGQKHYPILITKQSEIITSFPLDRPIVIESVFLEYNSIRKLEQAMEAELEYIERYLK